MRQQIFWSLIFQPLGIQKLWQRILQKITGGDLYEIIPSEPYTDEDLDYGNDQSRSSREMNDPAARPEISSEKIAVEEYTTLYLGYPIWHGQAPRIMDTFVEQYDFGGLTVIPFCTSGGSGIGSSAETLSELAGDGNWIEGQRFSSGVSEEEPHIFSPKDYVGAIMDLCQDRRGEYKEMTYLCLLYTSSRPLIDFYVSNFKIRCLTKNLAPLAECS